MKNNLLVILISLCVVVVLSFACGMPEDLKINLTTATEKPKKTSMPTPTFLLEDPIKPGEKSGDEPVIITGTIPFTSPFFLDSAAEPFVMLEDQAGFAARDLDFHFPLPGQTIGPAEMIDESTLSYSLTLPVVPQGTLLDLDNNGKSDKGVMVFAVAYWSNIWGAPFLEERDGTGWSTAYASTITDAERQYEINGGHLIIWAPDADQSFPSGFGDDKRLFTDDDPVQQVPAGYNIVDLNSEPFRIYKQSHVTFELVEGESGVNDYSGRTYSEAFEAMFKKVSTEYPFTTDKKIDWDALSNEYLPRVKKVKNTDDFYEILHDFTMELPDAHVGVTFNPDFFRKYYGGSFGMTLAELSDGRVLVTKVFPQSIANDNGIKPGAQIVKWNDKPVNDAIEMVVPLRPASTQHARRLEQLVYLTRVPVGTQVSITYKNPGETAKEIVVKATAEFESWYATIPYLNQDLLALPLEAKTIENKLAYINITTFSDDLNLMARLWDRQMKALVDNEVQGLIIDLRTNGGGSLGLAANFAGYFFDKEYEVSRNSYYNEVTGKFEYEGLPTKIKPAPTIFNGQVAVLVSPDCVSACEGFANLLAYEGRATIIGHYPTAGAEGEVGRGQYKMPGDFDMQFPTGRPETMDGKLLIEGEGVVPDVVVPVTEESALGEKDAVLEAAIKILKDKQK